MSGAALSAYELYASTSLLVVVQRLSCEAQMAQLATLHAGVRLHIARAEAPGNASQAYCVSFVLLCISQHILVELVRGEYLAARVAAPRVRLALALDALFRVGFEACWDLFNTARGAGMARYTTQCPVLGFLN